MNIYLDDKRVPDMSFKGYTCEFVIVRTYAEFCEVIDKNIRNIEFISFDHDLADFSEASERTGLDCANHLIEVCMDKNISLPNWYVHSDNTSGRENIIVKLINYMKIVEDRDVSKYSGYQRGYIGGEFI